MTSNLNGYIKMTSNIKIECAIHSLLLYYH